MKTTIIVTICLSISTFSRAQNAQEWINQKQTQVKYLLEQIAAFGVCSGYVKNGYKIASKGLSTIRSIKHGDLDMHSGYFNSLKVVSPRIRKYSKVAEIMLLDERIARLCKLSFGLENIKWLLHDEKDYLGKVNDNLRKECATDMDELLLLLTDGKLEMKDNERIDGINRIHEAMKDKFTFLQSFSNQTALLVLQRRNEHQDLKNLNKFHGLP